MKYEIIIIFLFMFLAVHLFGQSDALQIHGFVSQGFMMSDENNYQGQTKDGTFDFNEFGINFSTELITDLRAGLQLFARDLGELGNDEITLDWVYGDYKWKNWLGIRAGKMKMPAGLYNEYRDLDLARVNIFMPQGVYIETWRESCNAIKGMGLYGTLDGGTAGSIDYQLQAGVMKYESGTGLDKYIEEILFFSLDNYSQTTKYLANLIWETPVSGLRIGANTQTSSMKMSGMTIEGSWWEEKTVAIIRGIGAGMGVPLDQLPPVYTDKASYEYAKQWLYQTTGQTFTVDVVNTPIVSGVTDIKHYYASAEYTNGGLVLAAEYYLQKIKSYIDFTDYTALGLKTDKNFDFGGYYGSISYRFNDFIQAGTYYSEFYPDNGDKDGKDFEAEYGLPASYCYVKDLALSVRLDINPYWILKLEGHRFDGNANLFRAEQDNPAKVKENWMLFASKITYNF